MASFDDLFTTAQDGQAHDRPRNKILDTATR